MLIVRAIIRIVDNNIAIVGNDITIVDNNIAIVGNAIDFVWSATDIVSVSEAEARIDSASWTTRLEPNHHA